MEGCSLLVAVCEEMLEFAEPETHHFVVERRRSVESCGGKGCFWVELLL